jgi:hypothetical protein
MSPYNETELSTSYVAIYLKIVILKGVLSYI